jgi:hypothetical protein
MNTIEDRIRAAARAAADTVTPDDVPPLRLPAQRARRARGARGARRSWSFGSAWRRRLAPAAAAVAVVVVAIAAVTVSRVMHNSAPVPSPPATVTISSLVASGQVPRYYVAINGAGDAVVVATATGTTLATIRPPADSTIVAVTAAADDRTFILDEQLYAVPETSANQAVQTRNFYSFRLNSAGQPGALDQFLTLPAGQKVTGIALSPDGSKLALAVERSQHNLGINVYGLPHSSPFRTWTATAGTIGYGTDDAKSLSWTEDGSTLAFAWGSTNGVRLLNLKASSDNLLTASRAAFDGTSQGWACMFNPLLTPDGKTLVCGARVWSPDSISNDQIGYAEYAVATGKLVRVLGQRLTGPQGPYLTWTNASGSVLIAAIQADAESARITFGVVTGNRFVPLPWPAGLSVLSPAW